MQNMTIESRKKEINIKLQRIFDLLDNEGLQGLALTKHSNFQLDDGRREEHRHNMRRCWCDNPSDNKKRLLCDNEQHRSRKNARRRVA